MIIETFDHCTFRRNELRLKNSQPLADLLKIDFEKEQPHWGSILIARGFNPGGKTNHSKPVRGRMIAKDKISLRTKKGRKKELNFDKLSNKYNNEMDTDYWLHFHLRDDEFPHLNCSKCKEGKLFIKDKFKHYETYNSRLKSFDEFSYYEVDREYKFVGFLECDNYRCKEIYTITGTLTREPDEPYEDGSGQLCQDLFNYYSPEFISPPLEIIELKKEYPKTVNDALLESFKHFFFDNEACANKIRIALELLLDELGVTQLNKKGVDLALGIRIAEYEERDEKNAKLMKATKIIGNFGSHRKKIERKDVLDGYELLKAVLDDLYDNESEKLKLKAEQINSQNKPISKIGK